MIEKDVSSLHNLTPYYMLIYIFSLFPISFHRTWLASFQQRKEQERLLYPGKRTLPPGTQQLFNLSIKITDTHTQISMLVTMLWQQFVIKPFTVSPDNLKALLLLVSTDISFFLLKRRWKTELSRLLNSLGLSNYKKNVSNFACHYNIQQLMAMIAMCVTFMYNFYISMY